MRVFLLLFLSLASVSVCAQDNRDTLWGELSVGISKLSLIFHFNDSADGVISTLDVVEQATNGIPAKVNFYSADSINILVPSINAKYSGRFIDGIFVGEFVQMGMKFPLNLKRGMPVFNRPQTPVGPFEYKTEDLQFKNAKDGTMLNGTLTYPVGYNRKRRNVPIVIMVSGSGIQNRDEELFYHKPFAVIANYLANHGIASFRYDDRGYNGSAANIKEATTLTFMGDALCAVDFIKKSYKFGKTGIIGHSEGGTIAFMIAAQQKTDFIISMAAPAQRGDSILIYQMGGKVNYDRYLKHNTWIDYFISYDPIADIKKVTCPVFAINGSKDTQVPCEKNINLIRSSLPANNYNKIKAYNGLNHLFQHCNTGNAIEYSRIEETISPEVLNDIVIWIQSL